MVASETILTIVSVVATPASPVLTVGSSAISGQKVQVRLSGGTDGTTYKVTIKITTSNSNTIEGDGELQVEDL